MKKILIVINLMFLFIGNISATTKTYYSNYSNFSQPTSSYIESNDIIDVKKTTMYRYYKEEKKYGDYYLINKHNPNYPYADLNDSIKTGYTNWSEEVPNNEVGRSVKTRDVYYYRDMKKIRYIHFTDVDGGRNQLNINEIIVRANNQDISYTIYCEGCSDNFYEKVTNGKINSENSYVLHGGYLILDLKNYYNLSDLNIRFYLTDIDISEKKYTISTSRERNINSNIYNRVTTRLFFKHNNLDECKMREYQLDKLVFVDPEWDSTKKSYNLINATSTRQVEKALEYSYQDILYHHYNIKKLYADGYYESSPFGFPTKDENDSKEYYQSRKRDKIVIEDKIIINNKNKKLEDFVIENSTNNISIDSNINYEENGIYEVSYIFPFITIDKIVYVDIDENKKQPIDEEPVNEEPIDEEPVNDEPIDKEPVEEELVNDEPIDDKRVEENKPKVEPIEKLIPDGELKKEKIKEVEKQKILINTSHEKLNDKVNNNRENNKNNSISTNENKSNGVRKVIDKEAEEEKFSRNYIVIPVVILVMIGMFCYCKHKKSRNK